jgi:hypothetical protein
VSSRSCIDHAAVRGPLQTDLANVISCCVQEHERAPRIALYRVISVATTWGPPLIGGVASQGIRSFGLQFAIIAIFFIPATLLIAFAVPESAFNRAFKSWAQTPATAASLSGPQRSMRLPSRHPVPVERVRRYLVTMKPCIYKGGRQDLPTMLQAPNGLVAPTTLLLVLVSFLPLAALWGLVSSLSLLFSTLPWLAPPSAIGTLMSGPWLLSVITAGIFAFSPTWKRRFGRSTNALAIAAGSILVFISLLAFGLYLNASMAPKADFVLSFSNDGAISFPTLSFLLGMLAAGFYTMDAATLGPLINRSTQFTSSNLSVAFRCTADMEAAVAVWRSLLSGIFVIALPNAVWYWAGLRAACVGLAVAQALVAAAVGAVWWFHEEYVRRLDGRMLGCVDLAGLKQDRSFFDAD